MINLKYMLNFWRRNVLFYGGKYNLTNVLKPISYLPNFSASWGFKPSWFLTLWGTIPSLLIFAQSNLTYNKHQNTFYSILFGKKGQMPSCVIKKKNLNIYFLNLKTQLIHFSLFSITLLCFNLYSFPFSRIWVPKR